MTAPVAPRPIALALTGASGGQYGLRLLECLLRAQLPVYLMLSEAARIVLSMECSLTLPKRATDVQRELGTRYGAADGQLRVFGEQEWTAPVASGSARVRAMVICPCTTGCLSAVAVGASDNLIERAADVMLKEQRKLILVVRETPLSAVHLRHMLTLADMGAVIMPAAPGFYHAPTRLDDLVDFMVARVLDQLDLPQTLLKPWGQGD
jgi:4-hydroxy-3-polyprenylbenzoate decarboxylase